MGCGVGLTIGFIFGGFSILRCVCRYSLVWAAVLTSTSEVALDREVSSLLSRSTC